MSGVEAGTALVWALAAMSAAVNIIEASRSRKMPKRVDEGREGLKLNTRSTQEPVKVVYGRQKVGGNDVFIALSGTGNEYLFIVQTLSEGPCQGIAQIGGVDQLWLAGEPASSFGSSVSYWFHSGASDQSVDANLAAAFPAWADALRYTSYIAWRLTYDPDKFLSIPDRLVLLNGRTLYDFRTATTAWSDNPVLALYDYLTSGRYGCGLAAAKLDTASFSDAADYCDLKGFKLNMAISRDGACIDSVNAILAHFRGSLLWFDGKYYLRYADLNEESSVMSITDEHIARDEGGQAQIGIGEPSRFGKPDGMIVKYIDPELDYSTNDLPVGDETGVMETVELMGCTDREMAANLGVYHLERAKLCRTVTGLFRDDCRQLDPHDVVTLTSTALSISSQLMRVQEANIREDGLVELMLAYESLNLYDDDYNLTAESVYQCTLPDPTAEPPGVTGVSVSEETYNYRLRSFTRLKIAFSPPAGYPWYDHIEVWVSYDDAAWEHLFDSTSDFEIANVEEGQDYYIRLKVVSVWGGKQQDANDYKIYHLVGGYTTAPASLGALQAVVNQNTVNLYADKVTDTDVELYEFRLGNSWSGGIFLAALRAPNLSLYGVKPGTHLFIANTLSNNGSYGDTPRSAAVVLKDPPDGWAVQATEACNYNGVGTHDNTEHTVYNLEDYLKCSHTGGVLSGTYLSPVYDRGAVARYMIYVLTEIVVTGAGTTWGDVIPDPNIWDSIGISLKNWAEIFSLAAGPKVKIKLRYGETSPPTSVVERMEILSAIVTGRYFQVEIIIIDPSAAVNALVKAFSLKFCQ
ncbi:MAG: phage tail protein [Thermodesulfobacteriota bacterium]